jgi:hypothetical protein
MSTTAARVVELVKSLPEADQRAVLAALAGREANSGTARRRKLQRLPDGSCFNPNGIPNDDPVFIVLGHVEQARHRTTGPEAPKFR